MTGFGSSGVYICISHYTRDFLLIPSWTLTLSLPYIPDLPFRVLRAPNLYLLGKTIYAIF